MRLFTGIAIPPEITASLERVIHHLRPHAQLRWSPSYNLHITTKFIGEWPEERLEELRAALDTVPKPAPFRIDVKGLGWFPNPHVPRIFFAAVKAPATLGTLARDIDHVLEERLQIAPEKKAFAPHLTLARVTHTVPLTKLQATIAELASVDFGAFDATSYHLYLSKPGPAGSIYTQLAEFPLASE